MKNLRWLLVVACVGACKDKAKTGGETGATGGGATGPAVPETPLQPIGMTDPFARLGGDTAKTLQAGYKALRAKKYDDAQASFRAVTNASPDYTSAGWMLVLQPMRVDPKGTCAAAKGLIYSHM